MALSDIDRQLLQRCLARLPQSWEDFVDRFLGLVVHVINHSARACSVQLRTQDREDLAAEVFLELIRDDFAVLRRFRGQSSLATYLTVIARRVVLRKLLRLPSGNSQGPVSRISEQIPDRTAANPEQRIGDREQVERLLAGLHGPEADVIRMYHLEGKTYREISRQVGIPENTIGPTLSRARSKLRRAGAEG